MTTYALPATEHELGILTADKLLPVVLRPMEPPVEHAYDMEFNGGEWFRCSTDQKYLDHENIPSWVPLYQPGDVIAWQEEWCLDYSSPYTNEVGIHFPPNVHQHFEVSHETAVTVLCASGKGFQPAATMPESIARFRSTVAECKPVKIDDWHPDYPDYPVASTWEWWIDLQTEEEKSGD